MKLKDPFGPLDKLRRKIGSEEHKLRFDVFFGPLKEIEKELETTGIPFELPDIEFVGPFLTYKGELLAILYILNSNSPSEELLSNQPRFRTPKFHFAQCRTLDQMNAQNRFDRYVWSRSKTNRFRVEALETEDDQIRIHGERHILKDIRLFPCQNCLYKIHYHGFEWEQPDRLQQVHDFSIERYLEENDGNLTVMRHLPTTHAQNARAGGYTDDFPEISRKLREKCDWTCTLCRVDMSQKKAGLHVHHRNGVKNDNKRTNLKVLCAVCHKEIDEFHRTMYIKPDIRHYIEAHRPKST